jgi:hypothetical protein
MHLYVIRCYTYYVSEKFYSLGHVFPISVDVDANTADGFRRGNKSQIRFLIL